jgi:hypothetical protein
MVAEYTHTNSQPADADTGLGRRTQARLPSLVHELIHYGLVERTAPGVWHLKGDVQALLEQGATATAVEQPERLFIGLRCQVCGVRDTTALVHGRRLCPACRSSVEAEEEMHPMSQYLGPNRP